MTIFRNANSFSTVCFSEKDMSTEWAHRTHTRTATRRWNPTHRRVHLLWALRAWRLCQDMLELCLTATAPLLLWHIFTHVRSRNVFVEIDINKRKLLSNLLFCPSERICQKDVTCCCGLFISIRVSEPKTSFRLERLMDFFLDFLAVYWSAKMLKLKHWKQRQQSCRSVSQKLIIWVVKKCRSLDCPGHEEILIFCVFFLI